MFNNISVFKNKIMEYFRKKIPEFIKKPLRHFYNKWNVKLDDNTINDLCDYFSLDKKNILRLLENSDRLNTDLWLSINPKSEIEIKNFYHETPFYIFNLTFWHAKKEQQKIRSEIIGMSKGRVLDFGGGVGDMSIMASQKGLEADYADIPGRTFNFAKRMFKRKNCNIFMIDLEKDKIDKKYDTIFCIDVIEHIVNPKKTLGDLVGLLNDGGYLFITALNIAPDKNNPTHLVFDFDAKAYLKLLGMTEGKMPFLWIKQIK